MRSTVLFVEDNADLRELIAHALDEEGFDLLFAANVDEAMSVFLGRPVVDLILIDLYLAGTSGLELIQKISALPRRSQTKLVVFSGVDGLPKIAKDVNADGYLRKPFSLDTFAREIRRYLK